MFLLVAFDFGCLVCSGFRLLCLLGCVVGLFAGDWCCLDCVFAWFDTFRCCLLVLLFLLLIWRAVAWCYGLSLRLFAVLV